MQLPIVIEDSLCFAKEPGGQLRPLIMHGRQLLHEGVWTPINAYKQEDSEFVQVDFVTKDGHLAVHYYNANFEFVCNSVMALPQCEKALLIDSTAEAARMLRNKIVFGKLEKPIIFSQYFLSTSPGARCDAMRASRANVSERQVVLDLTLASDRQTLGELQATRADKCLNIDWSTAQHEAVKRGRGPKIPSAMTDNMAVPCAAIWLSGTRFVSTFAYLYFDEATGNTFFLICADNSDVGHRDWSFSIQAVYFPITRQLVYNDKQKSWFLNAYLNVDIEELLLSEIMIWPDAIANYIENGHNFVSSFLYFPHIGHNLWNELAGIDVCSEFELSPDFKFQIINCDKTEIFGSIENIFPFTSGKTERRLASKWEMRDFIYKNNVFPIHLTHHCISKRLAANIIKESVAMEPRTGEQCRALNEDGFKIIIIGLRIENRTLVDQVEFASNVIEALRNILGKVAIVIDGHNATRNGSKQDRSYGSVWNPNSTLDPILIEKGIVAALAEVFASDPHVKLISTVGRSMAESIVWASRALYSVSPWGAGLVKYKWISNIPGLVVMSSAFCQNPESHLYDNPRYREAVVPSQRTRICDVQDCADAEQLMPSTSPVQVNFKVDRKALLLRIEELIRSGQHEYTRDEKTFGLSGRKEGRSSPSR